MELNDNEQRILAEMERALHADDPDLVNRVRSETVYRFAGHRAIGSAVAFVFGLIFMFFTFASNIFLGMVGVAIMFAAGIIFVNNARRMGRAGFDDATRSLRSHTPANPGSSARDWFGEHFPHRNSGS